MKRYDYEKIRKKVFREVKRASFAKDNFFTSTVWAYHILPVVKHSLALSKKLVADVEVVEMAAFFHDYSCLLDKKYYEKHHLHSAQMAKEFLLKTGFPKEKIALVGKAIISHRGSVKSNRKSVEEKILASADAMAHISEPADMFYLAFGVHRFKTREGSVWLKEKIKRSWEKIIPEGKGIVESEYKMLSRVLDKSIKAPEK